MAILMMAIGLALVAGAFAIFLLGREPGPSTAAPQAQSASPDDIERLDAAEAKVAYDRGEAVFVDVRPAEYYRQNHIPGALSIPLGELEARLEELDRDRWIITYCT